MEQLVYPDDHKNKLPLSFVLVGHRRTDPVITPVILSIPAGQRHHVFPSLLGARYCCWEQNKRSDRVQRRNFCLRVKKRASKTHARTSTHTLVLYVTHAILFSRSHSESISPNLAATNNNITPRLFITIGSIFMPRSQIQG